MLVAAKISWYSLQISLAEKMLATSWLRNPFYYSIYSKEFEPCEMKEYKTDHFSMRM